MNLLYVVIAGLAFGHGGAPAPRGGEVPVRGPALERTLAPRPAGIWVATGHVLGAYGVASRSTGEVLRRTWSFGRRCRHARCRAEFSRTTSGLEIQSSVLRRHRGYLTAEFPRIDDGCEERPGWFADFDGEFTIWWSEDHRELEAIETGFFRGGGGCGPAAERIRWTARLRRGRQFSEGI